MKPAQRPIGFGSALRVPAWVVVFVVTLAAIGVGCSGDTEGASCSDAAVDFSLPTESFTDWVSYADQLSVVDVAAEQRLWPDPPEPGAPPHSYVGRRVDLRVGDPVWRRAGAPAAPPALSVVTDGWSIKGAMKPTTIGEGPRLEVGRRYLMGLVRLDNGDWAPYPRATLPLGPDGRLAGTCSPRPTLDALAGLTVEEATRVVAGTPPDPRAAAHGYLPPEQRFQTVHSGSVTPG